MQSFLNGDLDGPVTGAARMGKELREARQRLGLALPDVAAKLCIRLHFLEAVEDGRLADLPGHVYAVGFARAYATLLGVDANEAARRFRPEAQAGNQKAELVFPAPVSDRHVPAGAVVLLGVLLAAGAYAGWYHYSGDARPTAELVPVVPERLAALADRATPPPSPPQVASVPAEPSAGAPAHNSAPPSEEPVVVAAVPVAPVPPAAATDESRMLLRLNSDTWIQVRERQGHVLLNRVMRGGESWPVPKGAALLLTTGNAGGTELLVDGEATPPLGPSGAVRRDVALEPDMLKGGSTGRPPAQ